MIDTIALYLHQYPFLFAPLCGILPALFWLWFWLKEDKHPEPLIRLTLCFFLGMISVAFVLPLQKAVLPYITYTPLLYIVWSGIEELLKLGAAWLGGIHTRSSDEPVDPLIYMITTALGFVAVENTLFLFDPDMITNITDTIITGNMRFIGASLLHVVSSGVIGVFLSFSFYKTRRDHILYGFFGVILATLLHTYFNLFILYTSKDKIFFIFTGVWVCILILMVLFERIKHIIPKH
jgi:RsiW-degrading membrane proteinase PrsW (M82 family)